jgi:hypothetical protein
MRIFIGHDSRYPEATKACYKSIKQYNKKIKIIPLYKHKLVDKGIYGREDIEGESTEFSFTRFYVPLMSKYKGISMFCDNDFIFRDDVAKIFKQFKDNDLVSCVKHEYYESKSTKMDGIQNKSYPRKNWSSLMIFNNEKLKDILTKEYLDNASAADLHQLAWAQNEIGDIDKVWNHLVGEQNGASNAKGIHFTNGGPWFEEYKDCQFSDEWRKILES